MECSESKCVATYENAIPSKFRLCDLKWLRILLDRFIKHTTPQAATYVNCICLQTPQSINVWDLHQHLHPSHHPIEVDMENSNGTYEWEYYYDYIEPVIVDESKLKYHKCEYLSLKATTKLLSLGVMITVTNRCLFLLIDSVIIIFWISLSGLVGFLFLTLNLISHSGHIPG